MSMTTDNDWSSIPTGGGFYVKWEQIGDRVVGTLTAKGIGEDFNGNPCPKLDIETDEGPVTVNAGQANLKAQLLDLNVNNRLPVGCQIRIEFTGKEKAEKGDKKIFTIETKPPVQPTDESGW